MNYSERDISDSCLESVRENVGLGVLVGASLWFLPWCRLEQDVVSWNYMSLYEIRFLSSRKVEARFCDLENQDLF